jgi:transcription factor SPN1
MSDAEEDQRAASPQDNIQEYQDTPANDDASDAGSDKGSDDDLDSELSEVDEAEFADFDPANVALEDRPVVDIDEDVVKTLRASKKRRSDKDGEPKKPREAKRERKKKSRADADGDEFDDGADGQILDGKRRPKPKSARQENERRERERQKRRERSVDAQPGDPYEGMTEEQRRAAELDAKIDAALKAGTKKRGRKQTGEDLEAQLDEEIESLKKRMEQACEDDNNARERDQPAINKLRLLPEVTSMLSRTSVRHNLVDPDTNFLLAIRFFLEPLSDGSLPAYNIQRDLFNALMTLPIEKEALRSSGIGKIVLFYTKSKRPEIGIKRTAEKLLGEWSRLVLKRSDDYKKRKIATQDYDAQYATPSMAILDPPAFALLTITPGLHNLLFARVLPRLHRSILLLREIWSASVCWLDLPTATVPDSRHILPVTQLHRGAHSMRLKAQTRCLVQLVQAVRICSGG